MRQRNKRSLQGGIGEDPMPPFRFPDDNGKESMEKNPWKESRERIHKRIPRKVWYTYLTRGGYRVRPRAAGGRKG